MKNIFIKVGIQRILSELINDLPNGSYMIRFIDIDEGVILAKNYKNIVFICQYFIDMFLETCWYIRKTKQYPLIHKMAVSDTKRRLLLGFFANCPQIVDIDQVKLDILLCSI